MSIPMQVITYAVILPAVLSGIIFIIALQWAVRRSVMALYGGAVALSLGYMLGYIATLGQPTFPPVEPTQWLFHIAVMGCIVGVLEQLKQIPVWSKWSLRTIVVLTMSGLLLRPLIAYSWSTELSIGWCLALTSYALMLWATVDDLCKKVLIKRINPLLMIGVLIMWGTAQSIAIVVSKSVVLAQLQGVLVSTMGAVFVIFWALPRMSFSFSLPSLLPAAPVITMLFTAHAAAGYFYAELPMASVICLALAPVSAMLIWRKSEHTKFIWGGFSIAVVWLVTAIWLAVLNVPPDY